MKAQELRIGKGALWADARETRVVAEVGGEEVFFACAGAPLRAAPEAFASAFLLPATLRDTRIVMEEEVDSRWLAGAARIQTIASEWWGCATQVPGADESDATATDGAGGTGLCFTGGVDSFYSLLRRDPVVTHLVFVHGYDVARGDALRASAFEERLNAIARALRVQPVVVRTNLREHAWMRNAPWHRVFGGALAAVGHLLDAELGRLLIASS